MNEGANTYVLSKLQNAGEGDDGREILREFFAADVEGVEGVGAVGAVGAAYFYGVGSWHKVNGLTTFAAVKPLTLCLKRLSLIHI